MPYLNDVPLGCPLKDVSAIAIRQGRGYDIDYDNAHQIHIHVDGGYDPGQPSFESMDSCNATWAIAVVAVDEHMQRSEERRVGKECRSRWSPYH